MLTYTYRERPSAKDFLKSPIIKKKIKEIFGEDVKMEEVRIEKIDGQKIQKAMSNSILQRRVQDEIHIDKSALF